MGKCHLKQYMDGPRDHHTKLSQSKTNIKQYHLYSRTFPHQVDAVSHRRLAEGVRPIQGFQSCPLTLLPMMNPQGEDRPPLPQGQLHQAPGTPEAPREVPVLSTAHGPGQTSRGRFSDASAVGDAQSASCTDITRPVLTMSTLCLI